MPDPLEFCELKRPRVRGRAPLFSRLCNCIARVSIRPTRSPVSQSLFRWRDFIPRPALPLISQRNSRSRFRLHLQGSMFRGMATIGKRNTLSIVRASGPGLYLDGGELGEILLPGRYIPRDIAPKDKLDVFVYTDSEDRLVATTEIPLATVGEFACLKDRKSVV